ncbi:MAG: hypothetical protein SH809_02075 [Rhodothermales bacterium]|nr:hypothetical protein [Rhodothermales bacterium]
MGNLIQTTTYQAVPKGMLSNDFVLMKDGEEIGLLDIKAMREAATLHLGDEVFELGREGMMSGAFFLARGEEVVVKAVKPSAFKSEFEIHLGDQVLILKKEGLLSSGYELLQSEAVIGRIDRDGLLTRKATIELPADWPLPLQLFVYWLVQLMWNRDASAAAAT